MVTKDVTMTTAINDRKDFPASSQAVMEAARAGNFHRVEQLVLADRLTAIHEQFGKVAEVASLFEQAADAFYESVLERAVQALADLRRKRVTSSC